MVLEQNFGDAAVATSAERLAKEIAVASSHDCMAALRWDFPASNPKKQTLDCGQTVPREHGQAVHQLLFSSGLMTACFLRQL